MFNHKTCYLTLPSKPNHLSQQSTMKTTVETLQRLKKHGKMGNSYDYVVNKLLDKAEETQDV